MLAGGAVLYGVYLLLPRFVPIDPKSALSQAQRMTAAFASATALGAIAALVVNTRRQSLAEREALADHARDKRDLEIARARQFTESFAAAAAQLGKPSAAERIAGVYALSGLADEYTEKAQQCLDVLCGYLRLPWDPDLDSSSPAGRENSTLDESGRTSKGPTLGAVATHDAEVRKTIVEAIRVHLLAPEDERTWAKLSIDLRGARLLDARFTNAVFGGTYTSFDGARFEGDRTSFLGTRFQGQVTTFKGSTFAARHTSFSQAIFNGRDVTFRNSRFEGGEVTFDTCVAQSSSFTFRNTTFVSGIVSFVRSKLDSDSISLDKASFESEDTRFDGATRHGKPYDPRIPPSLVGGGS